MIIGIDIRVLGSGRRSGIEEYTEQLLAHMLPLDSTIQYKLFFSSYRQKLSAYPWLQLPNVKLYQFNIPNKLLFYGARLFQQPKIDRLLGGVDVFFSPHFFLAPLSRGVQRVITFHDLSFERFPEFFSWRQRFWHGVEMQPEHQAKIANKIIAVSESTARDLEDIYGIPHSKINTIYSGHALLQRPGALELKESQVAQGLPEEYVLFLGTLEPRKNSPMLIQAFNIVKSQPGFEKLHLVLAGNPGWSYQAVIREIARSPYRKQIVMRAAIADSERAVYYSLASMFVYPSFFEGFGFPPLEAMACGTPVIAAHTSSLPEVVGGAGILVSPYRVSALAHAMTAVLRDATLKKSLISKGLERVQQFTWQHAAQQTLEILTS